MMITDEEAKKAAEVLKEYCSNCDDCEVCIFVTDDDINCPLAKLPERWNLK